jgi:hypothetical protein
MAKKKFVSTSVGVVLASKALHEAGFKDLISIKEDGFYVDGFLIDLHVAWEKFCLKKYHLLNPIELIIGQSVAHEISKEIELEKNIDHPNKGNSSS